MNNYHCLCIFIASKLSVKSNTISWWIIAILVLVIIALIALVAIILSANHKKVNGDSMSVTDQYASKLCEIYSRALTKYMDLNYNKYPAIGPFVPFLPLISIIVEAGNRKKDTDWLLNATVSEVLQDKEIMKIPIEDILKPITADQQLRLVFIEGEPGIGKSTLAKELVLRWVKQSDLLLNKHKIVVFIQLRFNNFHNATKVDDLFIDAKNIDMRKVKLEVKNAEGAGVLWILDGFDELPYHLRKQSVFIELIKGDVLPKSTVIVTGRPVASEPLLTFLENDSKHISLRGFDTNKTHEYAKRYFNGSEIVLEFYSYYSGNPMIENMLYNPMNCYIVCTILNDFIANSNKQYPRTMTELYNHYVRVLLKRHLIDAKLIDTYYKMPQYLIKESDFKNSELENVWTNFSLLSKIAYNGVMKQEYIFGNDLHNVTKLSMLNTIVSFFVFDPHESSSFIHTTLQEYFSAVYLVNNDLDLESTFNKLNVNPNLKVVLNFYVGMSRIINREVGHTTLTILKKDVSQTKESLVMSSMLLRCLYEHDSLLYNMSLPLMDYTYYYLHPNTFDSYIIGYLVATHNITFAIEFTDPTQYKALNKGLSQFHSTVKGKLKIEVNVFWHRDNQTTRILKEIINISSHIPIVFFNFEFDSSHSIHNVKNLLYHIISKFESLQTIIIENISFNSTILQYHLQKLNQLNELRFMINCSYENDLKLLKQITAPGRPLRKLIVQCDGAHTSINTNVLNLIKNQSSLKELKIVLYTYFDLGSTVWHKSNNSLKVYCLLNYMDYCIEQVEAIKSVHLTSFTIVINLSMNSIMKFASITIYSEPMNFKLASFLNAFRILMPGNKLPTTASAVKRCYKIQLNSFMYAYYMKLYI